MGEYQALEWVNDYRLPPATQRAVCDALGIRVDARGVKRLSVDIVDSLTDTIKTHFTVPVEARAFQERRESVERLRDAGRDLLKLMRRADAAFGLETTPRRQKPTPRRTWFIYSRWHALEPELEAMVGSTSKWLSAPHLQFSQQRRGNPGLFRVRFRVFMTLQGAGFDLGAHDGPVARVLALIYDEIDRLKMTTPKQRKAFRAKEWREWTATFERSLACTLEALDARRQRK